MKLRVDNSKEAYRQLCDVEPSIPIFSQAWWLDAVSGREAWDVVLVYRGEQVVGALPYVLRSKWGFTVIGQPQLTQTLGPWIQESQAKYAKAKAFEKDVLQTLADHLPNFDCYLQNWHYSRMNWLPFYWRGFKQTTRYTYVIRDLSDGEKLWEELQENIRTDIRKARNRYAIVVRGNADVNEFLALSRKTFERQAKRIPYSEKLVQSLEAACVDRNCRRILIAEDQDGRSHAGAYIVWDANTAYYLIGGGDPQLRSSGAGSLCLWEAIRSVRDRVERFDFEGSMLEPVERFFRGFGAHQVPYFRVSKTPSRVLKLAQVIRGKL